MYISTIYAGCFLGKYKKLEKISWLILERKDPINICLKLFRFQNTGCQRFVKKYNNFKNLENERYLFKFIMCTYDIKNHFPISMKHF